MQFRYLYRKWAEVKLDFKSKLPPTSGAVLNYLNQRRPILHALQQLGCTDIPGEHRNVASLMESDELLWSLVLQNSDA